MKDRTQLTHRTRSIVLALVAVLAWALFSLVLPLAGIGSDATLFGLPLRTALALPIALPALVLTMFWHTARQNADDDRFGEDD